MISSAGTKPMKMYETVSLRRTRHSSRCFMSANSRTAEDQRADDEREVADGVDELDRRARCRTPASG